MNMNIFKHKSREQAPVLRPAPRDSFMHEVRGDPFLDWVLILSISFIVTLGLVGAGVYVYLDTGARLAAPSAAADKPVAGFDADALQIVLAEFEVRSTERDAIRKGYSAPRDPSLP